MKKILLFLLLPALFLSCKDDALTYEEQLAKDTELIEQYLRDNNLTAQKTASGLYYIITLPGQDGSPNYGSTVTLIYRGTLLDGAQFDATEPGKWDQLRVIEVVPGFGEALTLLEKKGRGKFFLPSGLAYGTRDIGTIPANSVLIFDIELVDFF